jgi:hypothetical protein
MKSLFKIFVTVPESHTEIIINAMSESGAGKVGLYSHCAFISKGIGTFKPEKTASPFSGEVGILNREPEDKVEMICEEQNLQSVINAILENHPYESPTIDVIKVDFYTK